MNKDRRKELPISAPLQEVIRYTLDLISQIFCDDYCRHPRELTARTDLTQDEKDELLENLCADCPLVKYL